MPAPQLPDASSIGTPERRSTPGQAPVDGGIVSGTVGGDPVGVGTYKVARSALGYYVPDRTESSGGLVEPEGRWMGRLARALKLDERPVDATSLSSVVDAIDPTSGDALYKVGAMRRIVAFDIVLAAPKSVSVLLALGEHATASALRAAHDASVEASVEYLERNVAFVRRHRDGTRIVEESGGLVVAGFVHRTSRAADPHLHTHLLVVNLGRDPDGCWSTLDARALFVHARASSALYGAHLRHAISTGVDLHFAPRRSGVIDLIGARDGTINLFSRRSLEVAASLEGGGFVSRRANRIAAEKTRAPKDLSIPWEALVEQWWERAGSAGLSADAVHSFGHRSWSVDEPRSPVSPDPVEIIGSFDRPFTRRELTTVLADRAVDGANASEIEARVDVALGSPAARPRRATYFVAEARGERRIPRSVPEPRWASAHIAEILDRIEGVIASAARVGADSDLHSALAEAAVAVRVDGGIESLSAIRREGARVRSLDRSIVAVAPTAALAGHFAAMTGIETSSALAPGRLGRHDLLAMVAPGSIAPHVWKTAFDRQQRTGIPMILVDRPVRQARGAREPRSMTAQSRRRVTRNLEIPRNVEVRFVPDPAALRRAALRAAADWARRGLGVVVVTSGAIGPLEASGIPAVGSREAAELARTDSMLAAVVVGDVRVLGSSGQRAFGLRRTHLLVEPLDPLARSAIDVSIEPRRPGRSRDGARREPALGR
ncbi:MAG TPA: MobF family relaxase [Acidimicrobiales bacterium]|nr:MobF family relaxase [Acidimicrobiales bacterium]